MKRSWCWSPAGSNLRALIDACQQGRIAAEIVAVFSNKAQAYGLQRAEAAGIAARAQDAKAYADRAAFDAALADAIDQYQPDLVVLAGYMRILSPRFVQRYAGRLLNIHPSLLPKYPGLHTHRQAIDNGDSEHGTSVHFVTEQLDGGPVILQAKVPIFADDEEDDVVERVQTRTHDLSAGGELVRRRPPGDARWRRGWTANACLSRATPPTEARSLNLPKRRPRGAVFRLHPFCEVILCTISRHRGAHMSSTASVRLRPLKGTICRSSTRWTTTPASCAIGLKNPTKPLSNFPISTTNTSTIRASAALSSSTKAPRSARGTGGDRSHPPPRRIPDHHRSRPRGKGYASTAARPAMDYGFSVLNLYKLYLIVDKENPKAIHIYSKLGFNVEGELIDEFFVNGEYRTVLRMCIFQPQYLAKFKTPNDKPLVK